MSFVNRCSIEGTLKRNHGVRIVCHYLITHVDNPVVLNLRIGSRRNDTSNISMYVLPFLPTHSRTTCGLNSKSNICKMKFLVIFHIVYYFTLVSNGKAFLMEISVDFDYHSLLHPVQLTTTNADTERFSTSTSTHLTGNINGS